MKRKQITAILLSAIMTVTACVPMNSISAFAAESSGAGNTETAAVVEMQEEEAPAEEAEPDTAVAAQEVQEEQTVEAEPAAEPEESGEEATEAEPAVEEAVEEEEKAEATVEDASEEAAAQSEEPVDEAAEEETAEPAAEETPEAEAVEKAEDQAAEADQAEAADQKADIAKEAAVVEETTETDKQKDAKKSADAVAAGSENMMDLEVGGSCYVSFDEESTSVYLRITPDQTAEYRIYADNCPDSSSDSVGTLYNSDFENIGYSDDDNGSHFQFEEILVAGRTYYVETRLYSSGMGEFYVYLEKIGDAGFYQDGDPYKTINYLPGEAVTLSVYAYSSIGEVVYSWTDENGNELAGNTSEYTFSPTGNEHIYCNATDGSNSCSWEFYLNASNELQIQPAGDEEYKVGYGESCTLETTVSARDMSQLEYQWYKEVFYSEDEGEWSEWEIIEGANGPSLAIESVTSVDRYRCEVSDQYGESASTYFSVRIENHFTAYPAGNEGFTWSYLDCKPNESVSLQVVVEADDMTGITYSWKRYAYDPEEGYYSYSETIEGADSGQYEITAKSKEYYECTVNDRYGNEARVEFNIRIDNGLKVSVNEYKDTSYANINAVPGEDLTLQLYVTANDMSQLIYKWEKEQHVFDAEEGEWKWVRTPVSETSSSITISPENARFECTVTDQFGNSKDCSFDVKINNQLRAYPEGDTSLNLLYGENYTLSVLVDAVDKSQIKYSWYKSTSEDDTIIEGENGAKLNIRAEEPATYYCYVRDQYGNTTNGPDDYDDSARVYVKFEVRIDNNLSAYPMGNDSSINIKTIQVSPGEEVVLTTLVTAEDQNGLNYSWIKDKEIIDGANDTSLTVKGEDKVYCCRVYDRFDNSAEAYFILYTDEVPSMNSLFGQVEVYPEGAEIVDGKRENSVHLYPATGESVNLKVITEGSIKPSFEWSYRICNNDVGASGYNYSYNRIKGTTSDNYTITAHGSAVYQCLVEYSVKENDGNGYKRQEETLYFYIHNNSFAVYPEGATKVGEFHNNYVRIVADRGSILNLNVLSEQDNTNLKYEWCWSSNYESMASIVDSTDSSIQVEANPHLDYRCLVTDENQNSEIVWFFIDTTDFQLSSESGEYLSDTDLVLHNGTYVDYKVNAQYGEPVTLKTDVTGCEPQAVTYQWEKYYFENGYHHYNRLPDNGDSIEIIANENIDYICTGYGPKGTRRNIAYHIVIDNGLYVYPDGAEVGEDGKKKSEITVSISDSETTELKTNVDAICKNDLSYRWLNEQGECITAKNTDKILITAEGNTVYRCVVTDIFGNSSTANFRVVTNGCVAHVWQEDYTVDKEPTCTEEGSESIHCSVCGEIDESTVRAIPKKDHAYGDWTVTKEATCTEAGSREKICADCGDKVTEEISATGHDWSDWTVIKEATEDEEGLETRTCRNDESHTEERSIPRLDHVHDLVKTGAKEATCTEDGNIEYWTCTKCGRIYSDEAAEKEVDASEVIVPAKGHSWNEDYTIDKEATCAEEGSESIHCSVCGVKDESTIRVIPKSDSHAYGDWTVTKAATCTEAGSREKVCADCGDKVTEEISATGHDWSDWTAIKEATEDEEGLETRTCRNDESHTEERSIPRLDHVHDLVKTGAKEATCTEDGNIEYWTCTKCGRIYSDEAAEKEVDASEVIVPAKGHSWNEDYTIDKEATCAEEGSESIHCLVCGVKDESTIRAISKSDNHAYGDWTVTKAATCTEAGSREKICADCGDKVTEEIPAASHKWNEKYTTDKAPTYTQTGIESIHCAICGTIKEGSERTVAKLPKPVSMLTVSGIAAKTYNGAAQTQALAVKDGNTTLTNGVHYTVSYANNVNAGTASVVIAGKGNYTGSVTKTFTISKAANAITAKNFTKTYSTKAQSFSLGAKAKGGTLKYKSSNTKVKVTSAGKVTLPAKYTGTVKITITAGNGNYNAVTKTITITIPSKTTLSKVTSPSAGKMKVTWKKNTKVTGYQIQYSLKSNFASPKTTTITKNSTVSKTFGSLKKGKKYYVRIRSYKTVSGKKYYSAWSAAKAVTVKK